MKLVMLDPATPERLDRIRPFLPGGWELATAASRLAEDQEAALDGAAFAIAGDVPASAAMMAVPGLRAVHKWGVGYDNIDLEAARRHGVRVLRTTGSNAVAVAETTLALILAVNRNIVRGHVGILNGGWPKSELAPTSMRLSGSTVGIIGFGHVGQALAALLQGFGCRVVYARRRPLEPAEDARLGVQHLPLEDLLRVSDVVTLNCELNDSTRNLINAQSLALMKPGAILVNVARGGVMDEEAVAEAVRSGHLRGVGVDVFATEPVPPGNPLLGLAQVVTTPHVGAISADGFAPSLRRMIANLKAIADGTEPDPLDVLV